MVALVPSEESLGELCTLQMRASSGVCLLGGNSDLLAGTCRVPIANPPFAKALGQSVGGQCHCARCGHVFPRGTQPRPGPLGEWVPEQRRDASLSTWKAEQR